MTNTNTSTFETFRVLLPLKMLAPHIEETIDDPMDDNIFESDIEGNPARR